MRASTIESTIAAPNEIRYGLVARSWWRSTVIDLIQKVDCRGKAAGGHHEKREHTVLGKVDTVHKAHDADANPTHEGDDGEREHNHNGQDGKHDEVKAATPARVRPDVRQTQELRLVHKAHGEQNRLRREEQRTKVELRVVAHHAFHGKLGAAFNKVEQEKRREKWETLAKEPAHLAHAPRAGFFRLQ